MSTAEDEPPAEVAAGPDRAEAGPASRPAELQR